MLRCASKGSPWSTCTHATSTVSDPLQRGLRPHHRRHPRAAPGSRPLRLLLRAPESGLRSSRRGPRPRRRPGSGHGVSDAVLAQLPGPGERQSARRRGGPGRADGRARHPPRAGGLRPRYGRLAAPPAGAWRARVPCLRQPAVRESGERRRTCPTSARSWRVCRRGRSGVSPASARRSSRSQGSPPPWRRASRSAWRTASGWTRSTLSLLPTSSWSGGFSALAEANGRALMAPPELRALLGLPVR